MSKMMAKYAPCVWAALMMYVCAITIYNTDNAFQCALLAVCWCFSRITKDAIETWKSPYDVDEAEVKK